MRTLFFVPALFALLAPREVFAADPVLENERIKLSFAQSTGALTVTVKETGDVWQQDVGTPYAISALTSSPTDITATVQNGSESFTVDLALAPTGVAFTASLTPTNGASHVRRPGYPYPFTLPASEGYYVQNTSGDGALFKLDDTSVPIEEKYDFIGIPWWGLTDFKKAMMTILDTPYSPADDNTLGSVCLGPVGLRYVFLPHGGYVELARAYRDDFFAKNPGLREDTLESRSSKPGFANLKDGVYIYLWDPADAGAGPGAQSGAFIAELADAGISHAVGTFYYGNTRLTPDEIFAMHTVTKSVGWMAGMYNEISGNIGKVAPGNNWPKNLMLGSDPVAFFAANPQGWDRTCGRYLSSLSPSTVDKVTANIDAFGLELNYFDTYVVQIAPCLDDTHPNHHPRMSGAFPLPSSYEEELANRIATLDAIRPHSSAVGSGEGMAPQWSIPHLDFYEGAMNLRNYGDIDSKIPSGDYNLDFAPAGSALPPGISTDELHRIPLLQLMFHDHVVSTWNWRNSNFQHLGTWQKKDLLNALYGTMPMWNMTVAFWAAHRQMFLDSYALLARSREQVGFDDMVAHGFLSDDHEVQFTDWASGVRIIANFDSTGARVADGLTVPSLDFVIVSRDGDTPPVDAGTVGGEDAGAVADAGTVDTGNPDAGTVAPSGSPPKSACGCGASGPALGLAALLLLRCFGNHLRARRRER